MAFNILKNGFSGLALFLGLLAALGLLRLILHGGNYTEQYAILFQIATLFFFYKTTRKNNFWYSILCGISFGLLFFTRQNEISIGIAIAIYLISDLCLFFNRKKVDRILLMGLGFGLICLGFSIYFISQNNFNQFIDAAFMYNQIYSDLGLLERLRALTNSLGFMLSLPLFFIALLSWLIVAILVFKYYAKKIVFILKAKWISFFFLTSGFGLIGLSLLPEIISPFQKEFGLVQRTFIGLGIFFIIIASLIKFKILDRVLFSRIEKLNFKPEDYSNQIITTITFIWMPFEIIMVSLSGRFYLHYYMALFVVSALLFVILAQKLENLLLQVFIKRGSLILTYGWIAGLTFLLYFNPFNSIVNMYTPNGDEEIINTVNYIKSNTDTNDTVLLWGAEPLVNFLSERPSPIRYVHLYPFYAKKYGGDILSNELLASIQYKKPILIINTNNIDTPFIKIENNGDCKKPNNSLLPGMDTVLDYICTHYRVEGNIKPLAWEIYRLN